MSRQLESALLQAKVPYRIVGTLRFYEREEVKDVVAFLRLLANRADELSFRRIVNKPPRGIGPTGLGQILADGSRAGDAGDLVALCRRAPEHLPTRTARPLHQFGILIEQIEELLPTDTLGEFIGKLLLRSGLKEHHAHNDPVIALQKTQNLEEMINAAALYPGTREGIVEFLESIELEGAQSSDRGRNAKVTLITMHNTKGLEFDQVLLTGLVEGLFPRSTVAADELEEERRLFYVAVTRARSRLWLSSFRQRLQYGRIVPSVPSRFLSEIAPELLQPAPGSLPATGFAGTGVRFPVGMEVYHDQYGQGVVMRRLRTGPNWLLFVRFESGREARFMEQYSRLERIQTEP